VNSTPAFARPLQHPGPRNPERRTSVPTRSTLRKTILPAGLTLNDAVEQALLELGGNAAQVEISAGHLADAQYVHPALCLDGTTAVTYSDVRHATCPARVVMGGMTVGCRDGERFTHCHMSWLDADGSLRGGHLLPDVVIGTGGISATIHVLHDLELRSALDAESRLPVFTPHKQSGRAPKATRRSVMSRLAPATSLEAEIREVMLEFGFTLARVDGSIGSLVGAAMSRRNGRPLIIDGPATEVAIFGEIDVSRDRNDISAIVVDRFGDTYYGILEPHQSLVAVTFELYLGEVGPCD